MNYKFACGACGQHLTASPELSGSEQDCPTCGAVFIVPEPFEQQQQPPPPRVTEALLAIQACAAEINALGIPYLIPPAMNGEQEEYLADLLSTVVTELRGLSVSAANLVMCERLTRHPTEEELRPLYRIVFEGGMNPSDAPPWMEMETMILETLPHLRRGEAS